MGVSEKVIVSKRVAHVGTRKPFGVPGQTAFSRLVLFPNEREHKLNALNHLSDCRAGVSRRQGRGLPSVVRAQFADLPPLPLGGGPWRLPPLRVLVAFSVCGGSARQCWGPLVEPMGEASGSGRRPGVGGLWSRARQSAPHSHRRQTPVPSPRPCPLTCPGKDSHDRAQSRGPLRWPRPAACVVGAWARGTLRLGRRPSSVALLSSLS